MLMFRQEGLEDVLQLPNPLSVLVLIKLRATLPAVLYYDIYYTVYPCLQASRYTLCIIVYRLSGLLAGLIYITFALLAL